MGARYQILNFKNKNQGTIIRVEESDKEMEKGIESRKQQNPTMEPKLTKNVYIERE